MSWNCIVASQSDSHSLRFTILCNCESVQTRSLQGDTCLCISTGTNVLLSPVPTAQPLLTVSITGSDQPPHHQMIHTLRYLSPHLCRNSSLSPVLPQPEPHWLATVSITGTGQAPQYVKISTSRYFSLHLHKNASLSLVPYSPSPSRFSTYISR